MSNSKSKVAIVSDTPVSALSNVAFRRAARIGADLIYASDYPSPALLLKCLEQEEYSDIMVVWREFLRDLLALERLRARYLKFVKTSRIFALIPDCLGLDPLVFDDEAYLLDSVHGYWTTSVELEKSYSETFSRRPIGVLHDLPDVDAIRSLRGTKKENKVIWVGNSAWGRRKGFDDYKGFFEIVIPLKERLQSELPSLEFVVIDSAKERRSHNETLRAIASARVLVQTSRGEGTGLPLLEALGTGTHVLTTRVGIAAEILRGPLAKYILPRDIEVFTAQLKSVLNEKDQSELIRSFEEFVTGIESDEINWFESSPKIRHRVSQSIISRVSIYFRWMFRYVRSWMRVQRSS